MFLILHTGLLGTMLLGLNITGDRLCDESDESLLAQSPEFNKQLTKFFWMEILRDFDHASCDQAGKFFAA
jgi:hypothetical protein